jgi:hypothetical protein
MPPAGAARTNYTSGRTPRVSRLAVIARIALAVFGGYAASAGFVATFSVALPLTGMVRSEAVVLSSMLGFIVYAALLLWGFAERRLWRFCFALALLAGGGAVALTGTGP